ncbi:MAG: putative metal-dependent hydrolase [Bacteroidetes bacterium]|nr:putative metal-dependent hydrolase [Bacteroidota bacterium]MBS1757567.1 putative metal-dependent hydrolase [Bacteroidota bacterium]
MNNLSFPIGKYIEQPFSDALLKQWLLDIETLPAKIEQAIANLDEAQLQTPYRPGGWTVHQLVHHVADSHMNAYIRFKLGLTENNPTIKPYDQDAWATMADTKNLPVNISTTILFAVHKRWMEVLKNISGHHWERTIVHPEYQKKMTLWELLGLYAWHGRHHVAHINALRERNNW